MLLSKRQLKKNNKKQLRKNKKKLEYTESKLVTAYTNHDKVDGCGIVLLNNKMQILFRKWQDVYYIPKGHRKIGETCLQGSIRELQKYTSIEEKEYDFIIDYPLVIEYQQYYHTSGWKYHGHSVDKTMYFYFAVLKDNIIDLPANQYGSYFWIDITNQQLFKLEDNFKYITLFINEHIKDYFESL